MAACESEDYCDYMHRHLPQFRMVLPKGGPMPSGTTADDWELVRTRPAALLSVDGRRQVDQDGYAIIRVNVTIAELQSL